ncbi:MAG: hypothetical protein ABFE16_02515 [Armatimonadia bacterium]
MADEEARLCIADEPAPEPESEAQETTPVRRWGRCRRMAVIAAVLVAGVLAGLQCQAWRLTRRAEALLQQGSVSEALPLAQRAARWGPWYGPAYLASGRAKAGTAPAAATIDLSLGLTLAPWHGAEGYVALCQIASDRMDSANSALGVSAHGLRWFPTSRYLNEYHAAALYKNRDYAGAYAQFRHALTLPGQRPLTDQNRARICMRLAECADRLTQHLEAAGWYCQADALSGRDDPDLAQGIVSELLLAGDVPRALTWAAEMVRRDSSPAATGRAICIFAAAGRREQAMEVLAQVARRRDLMPGEREFCLARAHNHLGEYEQSLALAREGYAVAETGLDQAQAAVLIGSALVGMGRYAEGATWLEKPGTSRWGWEKYRALVKAYTGMNEPAKKDTAATSLAKYSDMEKMDATLVDFARRNSTAAKTGA